MPEAPSTRPVRDVRPTLQNAFRRIQMLRAFACSPCLARLRLNEYAGDSRTRSPFTHRRSRQRNRGFLPARSRSSACLAAPRGYATRDASEPTSATQHFFDYEHPRLVGSRTESPSFRLALDGGPSVSRRPIRFGCSCGFVTWGGVVFPRLPQVIHLGHEPYERASGTSVASPLFIDGACARIDRHQVRLGSFYRVSVKITRCPQPEMPSIDK